eukprot:1147992-Pelagomonas_calceolata.AAC.8
MACYGHAMDPQAGGEHVAHFVVALVGAISLLGFMLDSQAWEQLSVDGTFLGKGLAHFSDSQPGVPRKQSQEQR